MLIINRTRNIIEVAILGIVEEKSFTLDMIRPYTDIPQTIILPIIPEINSKRAVDSSCLFWLNKNIVKPSKIEKTVAESCARADNENKYVL